MIPIPPEILAAIEAPTTRVISKVDIYEADATTVWREDVPFVDGAVTVDSAREEKRSFDFVLDNSDEDINHHPDDFWYDKVIKPYRGVALADGTEWYAPLGEFVIDRIAEAHFPRDIRVTTRDMTKKLLTSKFGQPTSFASGLRVEDIIKHIALNGGIDKVAIAATGSTSQKAWAFDAGTTRWKAISDIATAYGYELFFDVYGYLVMREFQDPVMAPQSMEFFTGPGGNLASYEKNTGDSRVYNHVVVKGEGNNSVPVYAEVRNTDPSSPTNIDRIGERTYQYTSAFISTVAQATQVALNFLAIHALESYELGLDAICYPHLDSGEICSFIDPSPHPNQPVRFLLSNLTIPLGLGMMSVQAKRVEMIAQDETSTV